MYKVEKETFLGKKIKIIWNDGRGEHFFNNLRNFVKKKKYQTNDNNLYSRTKWRSWTQKKPLVENVRSMTNFAKLPNSFWVKVVFITNYIQNRVPILVLVGKITLKEKWMDKEKMLFDLFKNLWMCCIRAHT